MFILCTLYYKEWQMFEIELLTISYFFLITIPDQILFTFVCPCEMGWNFLKCAFKTYEIETLKEFRGFSTVQNNIVSQ